MRAFTKRPLVLVLAVLILLDIVSIQTVLSRDKKDPATPRAAFSTRTPPGVMPVTVTPPSVVTGHAPTPKATAAPEPPATPTPTPEATLTPKATPAPKDEDPPDSTGTEPLVHIKGQSFAARPFETVRMEGSYVGSSARTILRVQHRRGGHWVDFPLPTTTDESGNFTVHVELGTTGEHQVRVVDPRTHTVSETVLVVIR